MTRAKGPINSKARKKLPPIVTLVRTSLECLCGFLVPMSDFVRYWENAIGADEVCTMRAMLKWEYFVANTGGDVVILPGGALMPIHEFLNLKGEEGWELVTTAALIKSPVLFFKRPRLKKR
jgi:hypothetical protein